MYTLQELRTKGTVCFHSILRENARIVYYNNFKKENLSCLKCGYDKIVQICHIKEIKSFNKTARMSEVNHINNLIHLCPNCHWELDHNYISDNDLLELLNKKNLLLE